MKLLKKLAYSKFIILPLRIFLLLFYDSKYLKGKFFEEKRIGYLWCLRSLKKIIQLHSQNVRWPVNNATTILNGNNIKFDVSSINVFQNSGCYFQAFEEIKIGKNVWIAKNVGIITANHNLKNPDLHSQGKPVIIGDKCWIGMNSVILPGVTLGKNTIVGAGAVVTKSFVEGSCVIAGNPAKVIKYI